MDGVLYVLLGCELPYFTLVQDTSTLTFADWLTMSPFPWGTSTSTSYLAAGAKEPSITLLAWLGLAWLLF